MDDGTDLKALKGPLGILHEIVQPPLPVNRLSKPLQAEIASEENAQIILKRLERYKLQNIARFLLPEERVAKCMRVPRVSHVQVWKSAQKTHYGGLCVCGSLWHDPVCASKISEKRSHEITTAIEMHLAAGASVQMLTLTLPHAHDEALDLVLGNFTAARRLYYNRKTWGRLAADARYLGSIRALEVTQGRNGWHVHSHEALFAERPITGNEELASAWRGAVVDTGWRSPNGHGWDLEPVWSAQDYLGKFGRDRKWSASKELTKAMQKQGSAQNRTPWDLLRAVEDGDLRAGKLFQEYSQAFRGKHQIEWSKGLRARFGLQKEKTDLQLATEIEEEAVLLGQLTRQEWRLVVQAEKRGELLEVARVAGWPGVECLIREIIRE